MKLFTKIIRKYFALLALPGLLLFIFSGCQKIINVELNNASEQIVIEGMITNLPGPYTVSVSKSGSYFDQPLLPRVSDAIVIISDNSGTIDTLKETDPGIYKTSLTTGIPGRTYTLKVLSENIEYKASSTMYSKVDIDTLTLNKSQFFHIGIGGNNDNIKNVEIHCLFKDPNEKNYYRIKVFRNDTTNTDSYRLYDDQYANGQRTELRASRATSGNTYRIELFSIDRNTFLYYRTLEDLLHINPFFGSTPANPNTNLSNGALGYFGACSITSKTIIVPDSLFNAAK